MVETREQFHDSRRPGSQKTRASASATLASTAAAAEATIASLDAELALATAAASPAHIEPYSDISQTENSEFESESDTLTR